MALAAILIFTGYKLVKISLFKEFLFRLRKDVSFLNKPIIKKKMEEVPEKAYVLIDATRADFIDKDVIEEINNFMLHAHLKNIKVEIKKSGYKSVHFLFNEPQILN